jgi:hypothetical protein
MRRTSLSWIAVALTAALACSDRSPTSPVSLSKGSNPEQIAASPPIEPRAAVHPVAPRGRRGPVPEGVWGGEQASLTINRDGGLIQLFCAFGSIDQAIVTDQSGRFDVGGTQTPMMGALPIGGLPRHPARYAGTTDGRTMTLRITVPDLQQTLGPFSLVYGVNSSLTPCMVP